MTIHFQECPEGLIYVYDPLGSGCLDPDEVDACSEFGQGYCPQVPCEPEGSTEPYYIYDCSATYCDCAGGIWEEQVGVTVIHGYGLEHMC